MKLINPEESDGLLSSIRSAIEGVLKTESERILNEFSLELLTKPPTCSNPCGESHRMVMNVTDRDQLEQ
jgi:hypothetical protein